MDWTRAQFKALTAMIVYSKQQWEDYNRLMLINNYYICMIFFPTKNTPNKYYEKNGMT